MDKKEDQIKQGIHKEITIKVILEGDRIASLTATTGMDMSIAENKLIVIGALETLKRNQLNKLDTTFSKTKRLNTQDDKKEDNK